MALDFELPPELCCRPLALVGLAGLDIQVNPVHRSLWEMFTSQTKTERVPLRFVAIDTNKPCSPAKPERTSYEWYVPKGILKRNWLHKHLYKIPAVAVLFFDLDWNDPNWAHKHIECSLQVQTLRATFSGRGTRIVVVLNQSQSPLPPGEDIVAAEKAASICQACELPAKSLFVLPCKSDHLQGYALRLESAFYELAQSYYHHSARHVRSHREHLNKTSHGYLFVRHLFKSAFYNELKQDIALAHKHYGQAYSYLLECRITDANSVELKTVASYIGYKVWKTSFSLNLPRDAIAHFRSHIDYFRHRNAPTSLLFEHHAWLSKQFAIFGSLFDEAIKLGLPAIQTQHPGFYFQQAALQANLRNKAFKEDYPSMVPYSSPDIPESAVHHLEFYGQRSWRPGRLSLEQNDSQKELEGLATLAQYEQRHVNHSEIIISLLSSAVNQFKNYRSPRMKQHLMVQMAQVYFECGNYEEALTLLEPLLWEYKRESWWKLATVLLVIASKCALYSAKVKEYVTFAAELCGSKTYLSTEEKTQMFENLQRLLKGQAPVIDETLEGHVEISQKWESSLSSLRCLATVPVNNMSAFVEVKVNFTKAYFYADNPIQLEVCLKCWQPTEFSTLTIGFSNPTYNECCQMVAPMVFQSGEEKTFRFEFAAEEEEIGSELQVTCVLLQMGPEESRHLLLKCEGCPSEESPSAQLWHQFSAFRMVHGYRQANFANLIPQPCTEIRRRKPCLDLRIQQFPPALKGEYYPLWLSVENKEAFVIRDTELSVSLDHEKSGGFLALTPNSGSNSVGVALLNLFLDKLQPGEIVTELFYLRNDDSFFSSLSIKVIYQGQLRVLEKEVSFHCEHSEVLDIPIVTPVKVNIVYENLRFQPFVNNEVQGGEQFLIRPLISNAFPLSLSILNSSLSLVSEVEALGSQIVGLEIGANESAGEYYVSRADESCNGNEQGLYSLSWKRNPPLEFSSADLSLKDVQAVMSVLPAATITLPLPPVNIVNRPLRITADLPPYGWVRKPMAAAINITNIGPGLLELDAIMDSNDAFMFAGNKHIAIRIIPGDTFRLTYNLYPLLAGYVALPPLKLSVSNNNLVSGTVTNAVVQECLDKVLPTHIYVMPQTREPTLSREE